MKSYTMGLCSSRHEMPVDSFIFPTELNPTDFDGMRKMALDAIPADADELTVYVTGLTAAMLAVADVCEMRKTGLTAMHFDRESGNYLPQRVLSFQTCPFCHKRHQNPAWYCPYCGAT